MVSDPHCPQYIPVNDVVSMQIVDPLEHLPKEAFDCKESLTRKPIDILLQKNTYLDSW